MIDEFKKNIKIKIKNAQRKDCLGSIDLAQFRMLSSVADAVAVPSFHSTHPRLSSNFVAYAMAKGLHATQMSALPCVAGIGMLQTHGGRFPAARNALSFMES